jgi:thymidylate synthase
MNNLDEQYIDLLKNILENGVVKKDRTGTGTKSIFGHTIRHNMADGFPLLTTKKLPFKNIATELLWFLRGETNIKYLLENKCKIWNGDTYKNFKKKVTQDPAYSIEDLLMLPDTEEKFSEKILNDEEFAKKWGDLGPIYGKQWRRWNALSGDIIELEDGEEIDFTDSSLDISYQIDQIQQSIDMLKTDPDSRRNIVSAWNVAELKNMVLPPCHNFFQLYTRELSIDERLDLAFEKYDNFDPVDFGIPAKIDHDEIDKLYPVPRRAVSLMWNQRSVDTFLGLPFNIASYGLLLTIIGEIVNMVPDQLIGNLGDTHLYLNHLEQAQEQIGRDLTPEERYNHWFDHNYETGMEKFFDPNNLPDYDNPFYYSTPTRTREPFSLPQVSINTEFWAPGTEDGCGMGPGTYSDNMDGLIQSFLPADFQIENYKAHPHIPAPLSN